jgi:hypothetical protein
MSPRKVERKVLPAPEAGKAEAADSVEVYKKCNDAMTQFCGEKVQVSATGREYFVLPLTAKESVLGNVNLTWPIK